MKRIPIILMTACAVLLLQRPAMSDEIQLGIKASDVVANPAREGVERGFVEVTLPAVLDSVYLDVAELVLTVSTSFDTTEPLFIGVAPATGANPIASLRSAGSWDESATEGFDPEFLFALPVYTSEAQAEVRIDVTPIVRRWLSGDSQNYGFVIKGLTENKSTFRWIRNGQYDGADAKLVVYYSRL